MVSRGDFLAAGAVAGAIGAAVSSEVAQAASPGGKLKIPEAGPRGPRELTAVRNPPGTFLNCRLDSHSGPFLTNASECLFS